MRKATFICGAVLALAMLTGTAQAVTPDTNMQRIVESWMMAQIQSGVIPESYNKDGGVVLESLYFAHNLICDTFAIDMWNPLIFCTSSHIAFGVGLPNANNGSSRYQFVLPDNKWFYIPGHVTQLVLTKLAADTASNTIHGVLGLTGKPTYKYRLTN